VVILFRYFTFSVDVAHAFVHKALENEDKRMKTTISVPIETSLFIQLSDFLRSEGDKRDPVEMISVAIEYWLDSADWKPELIQSEDQSAGYLWKEVFLPSGTEVRMAYKGANHRAKVVGDKIVYQGNPISPGRMVNLISGTSRSAWRDLWVKRPQDKVWLQAELVRQQCRAL